MPIPSRFIDGPDNPLPDIDGDDGSSVEDMAPYDDDNNARPL